MGKIYTLKNQADFTNRLLPGNFVNYHDAEEGEEFDFEMAADATSESGEDCTVYWIFSHTKGESDSDWDSFDYTDVDRIVCEPLEDEDDLDEEYEDLDESNLNESTSDWSNKQVIDSRDIIERLQELEDDVENLDESDKEELELLRAVNEDGQNYSDWEHGESLINDSYWVDYVQEMLEDTGDMPKDLPHYIVIDWESTARNIQYDYVSIDVGGTDFWIRN